LREIVKLAVEEDIIEYNIGNNHHSAVFTSGPPRGETEEGLLIFLQVFSSPIKLDLICQ